MTTTISSRGIIRATLPRRFHQTSRRAGRLVLGVVLAMILVPQALRPADPIELRPVDILLREAAAAGEAQRIEALLGQGANPNTVDRDGVTPLMIAVVGDVERVRRMIKKGMVKAFLTGFQGLISAVDGDVASAQALLNGGAQVDQATRRGITPLALAALGGDGEMVGTLLKAGAEVDHQAKRGETALMVAALTGHTPIVAVLLAAGADPTLRTRDGLTAGVLALLVGQAEARALLAEAENKAQ